MNENKKNERCGHIIMAHDGEVCSLSGGSCEGICESFATREEILIRHEQSMKKGKHK